jgi:murein DD-endopeptidase MepM/ murein hydrolase activator NlpD
MPTARSAASGSYAFNTALEIPSSSGQFAHAILAGEVFEIGVDFVQLKHTSPQGIFYSRYQGLTFVAVADGQTGPTGWVIGTTGTSLLLEIRWGGPGPTYSVNPLGLLPWYPSQLDCPTEVPQLSFERLQEEPAIFDITITTTGCAVSFVQ